MTERDLFHIAYLVDHPAHIPTLARWHHDQWSYLDVGVSVERRAAALARHGKGEIPTTVIALSAAQDETPGEILLGSASLIAHDMDTRPDLSPWLASVYVAPAQRGQGIGSALVRRIVEEARRLDCPMIYLFTPDKEAFYTRLGWRVIDRTVYRGYPEVVMACLPSPV